MQTCFASHNWRGFLGWLMALTIVLGLVSCNLSRPPAKLLNPPIHFLKFVSIARQSALTGYFSLADISTNQVAADGSLRIQVYNMTPVSMGSSDSTVSVPSSMKLKTVFYDNTFNVAVSNFHWESHGSFLSTHDLYFRFAVPYSSFKIPPRVGSQATVQLDFSPRLGTNFLSVAKNVILY